MTILDNKDHTLGSRKIIKAYPEINILALCPDQSTEQKYSFLNVYDKEVEGNINQCDINSTAKLLFQIQYININGNYSYNNNNITKILYHKYANLLFGSNVMMWDQNNINEGYIISFSREVFKDKINENNFSFWLTKTEDDNSIHEFIIDKNDYFEYNNSKFYWLKENSYKIGYINLEKGIIFLNILSLEGEDYINTGDFSNDHPNLVLFSNLDISTNVSHPIKISYEYETKSMIFFIRIKNEDYNYSLNPSFSDSKGLLKFETMVFDPQTFITTVGLYNNKNELLAVAKLNKPLVKNFQNEYLLKLKLEF